MTNEELPDMFFVRTYNENNKEYRNSTMLLGVGYDESNSILYLIFRKCKSIYRYLEVPKEHFDVIKDQDAKVSKGQYCRHHIINEKNPNVFKYKCTKTKPFEYEDSDLIDYQESFWEQAWQPPNRSIRKPLRERVLVKKHERSAQWL